MILKLKAHQNFVFCKLIRVLQKFKFFFNWSDTATGWTVSFPVFSVWIRYKLSHVMQSIWSGESFVTCDVHKNTAVVQSLLNHAPDVNSGTSQRCCLRYF